MIRIHQSRASLRSFYEYIFAWRPFLSRCDSTRLLPRTADFRSAGEQNKSDTPAIGYQT